MPDCATTSIRAGRWVPTSATCSTARITKYRFIREPTSSITACRCVAASSSFRCGSNTEPAALCIKTWQTQTPFNDCCNKQMLKGVCIKWYRWSYKAKEYLRMNSRGRRRCTVWVMNSDRTMHAALVGVVTCQVLQLMYFWNLEIKSVNTIQLSDNLYWK